MVISLLKRWSVATIGYAGCSQEEFIRLLLKNGIQCVIDIRSKPMSKVKYCNKKQLEALLSSKGISYVYLGKALGGLGYSDYQSYIQRSDFELGFVRLKALAMQKATAIMCLEKRSENCHRRWIASALEQEGWHITHIEQ